MAADVILDFRTNLNNSGSMHSIVIKFYSEHRLGIPDMILGSKMEFCKIQDGRRRPTEIYKIAIISKRLVQSGQNLAGIIYYAPVMRKYC